MSSSSDYLDTRDSQFEKSISTLDGLLYAIKYDEDHTFAFRTNPERARPFTNPPQPRRWAILGRKKRSPGQGHISTWDLKDEKGQNIGFCYTKEGGQIGIPLERTERGKGTIYDPPDSCDWVVTEVHIVRTSALDEQSRYEIYAALRRLIVISPA